MNHKKADWVGLPCFQPRCHKLLKVQNCVCRIGLLWFFCEEFLCYCCFFSLNVGTHRLARAIKMKVMKGEEERGCYLCTEVSSKAGGPVACDFSCSVDSKSKTSSSTNEGNGRRTLLGRKGWLEGCTSNWMWFELQKL